MKADRLFADRYRFISSLGKGGMGEVYLVEDTLLSERVALKLIKKEATLNPAYVEKFIYEVKLTRKISHPNVVRTFDLGWADGCLYYTMEYVTGDSLRNYLKKIRQLPFNLVLKFLIQISEGLVEIHKAGVIHRDLKPANIILTENLDCKIADFGIANLLTGSPIHLDQKIYGSFGYMAPEIWTGKKPDFKSDIYSLGVIAYELCTGNCPFDSDSTQVAYENHLHLVPKTLKEVNPSIPTSFSSLVNSMLEKNPDLRPVSAEIVKRTLQTIADSLKSTNGNGVTLSKVQAEEGVETSRSRKKPIRGVMAFKRTKSSNDKGKLSNKTQNASETTTNRYLVVALFLLVAFTVFKKLTADQPTLNLSLHLSTLAVVAMLPVVIFSSAHVFSSRTVKIVIGSYFVMFFTAYFLLEFFVAKGRITQNFTESASYFLSSKVSELLLFNFESKKFAYDNTKDAFLLVGSESFGPTNGFLIFSYLFLMLTVLPLQVRLLCAFGIFGLALGLNILRSVFVRNDFSLWFYPHATLMTLLSAIIVWIAIALIRFYFYRDYAIAREDPYRLRVLTQPSKPEIPV